MARDPMSGQEIDERLPPPRTTDTGRFPPMYDGPDRRGGDDGSGPFAGLPVWARVLAIIGLPGAAMLYLLWVGSQSLPKLEAELIAMRLEAERNRLAVQQQVAQGEATFRLMQKICANGAKSDEERGRCFDR